MLYYLGVVCIFYADYTFVVDKIQEQIEKGDWF